MTEQEQANNLDTAQKTQAQTPQPQEQTSQIQAQTPQPQKPNSSVQAPTGVLKKGRSKKADPDRIGTERIGKLLLEFSIPAIISMIFNSLYNVVDTAFLGHAVGEVGVAVTTLAFPVMTILMGFSALAGQGGNALAAIQLGEGKKKLVERTLGNSALLLLVLACCVAVAGSTFIDPLLTVIGTTEELWVPTKTFVQIICVGFIFQSLGMGLNNFLRTAGKPNLALGTMVMGTTICIVLNYLFVMVFGWGIAGSAYATITGQACGMIPVLGYFIFSNNAPFNLRLKCLIPDFPLMGKILTLGLASFAMQIASTVVNIVFNHVVAIHAANDPIGVAGALGAMGVAGKATTFAIMPMIGLIMGAQPIIGYNYGAKKWHRVLATLKWASVVGVCIGSVFLAVVLVIPDAIVMLFGVTGELEHFAAWALQVYSCLFPLVGFQIVGSSYFQSSGQPLKAVILELTRQVIFLIPLYLLLPQVLMGIVGTTGLQGVIICGPVSDGLATTVTSIFVFREVRKLRRMRDEQQKSEGEGPQKTPVSVA